MRLAAFTRDGIDRAVAGADGTAGADIRQDLDSGSARGRLWPGSAFR